MTITKQQSATEHNILQSEDGLNWQNYLDDVIKNWKPWKEEHPKGTIKDYIEEWDWNEKHPW